MNESAFEQMAPRLRKRAMETSRNCGATPMEAEDVAQDVLLRLWQMHDELERFRSLEAVVVKMARWTTLNLHRRKPMADVDAPTMTRFVALDATPAERMEELDNDEWLAQRLERLPSTQHTVLVMRQVERRSGKETARLLGITEESVRTLLSRARRQLYEDIKRRK